jgi:prepilin-type N-terminal cleavage/methylation domain-containing protein
MVGGHEGPESLDETRRARTPLRRTHTRMRDTNVTAPSKKRFENVRGFTLLELLVTMALLTITIGIAMPGSSRRGLALWNANEQLLSDLRRTRADALIRGDHFRLSILSASTYEERRLKLVGTEWLPEGAPIRSRTLPDGITFSAGVGKHLEFNTRGLLVDPDSAGTLVLGDSGTGKSRETTVWPSGQVIGS